MAAIKPGVKCTLRKGRKSGEEVEVTKVEGSFASVKTSKGKEKKVALVHLEPV